MENFQISENNKSVLEKINELDDELRYSYKEFVNALIELIKESDIVIFKKSDFANYISDKKIAEGAFGEIWKATKDGEDYAIKVIKDFQITNDEGTLTDANQKGIIKMLLSELISISMLDHPNILKLHGVIVDMGDEKFPKIAMIFTFIDGQDFNQYLAHNRNLSKEALMDYAINITEILKYVHKFNIVHRDIKTENIMITKKEKKLILVDFGVAKINDKVVSQTASMKGTPRYSAPECYDDQGDENFIGHISTKFDVWSLGCVIYEMFSGEIPWKKFPDASKIILALQKNDPFPFNPDFEKKFPNLHALLQRCLDYEVESRLSSEEFLEELIALKEGEDY